jgi:phosphatidylserine/phosphatidylglycerophosphate/cardiolipin synthase-like enzyme
MLIHGPLVQEIRENYFRLHAVFESRSAPHKPQQLAKRYFALNPNKERISTDNLPGGPLRKVSKLAFFGSDPDCPRNAITEEYIRLIKTARKTITISNMEFVLVPEIKAALAEAKRLNPQLKVTLITNGTQRKSPTIFPKKAPAMIMNQPSLVHPRKSPSSLKPTSITF